MIKTLRWAVLLSVVLLGLFSLTVQAKGPVINVVQLKGTINGVMADYVKRGIQESEDTQAAACIIRMDTPGGLDSSMRDIVQSIESSTVPVIVYVSPSGARAASAGVFITMAAHVAAMASDTNIGAAHPVALDASGNIQSVPDDVAQKILNDASAFVRSLATSHQRNADWAEKAVRQSVSLTAAEALKMNVVDLVAPNMDSLLVQLDGRQVSLNNGSVVALSTSGAQLVPVDMSFVESFLYTVSNPNVAYILLTIGALGIVAELFSPALIFPGIIGGICLLLAFYALGSLPVNWAGVLLILLGFGLFIAELFTPGFGALFAGGLVALLIGSLILFRGGSPLFQVDWWIIAVVIALIAGFVAFVIFRVVRTYKRPATTGKEDLKGKTALVKDHLNPEGTILYQGEIWNAISKSGPVSSGEEVTITDIEGLKLSVIKKAKE
jgi:membrane-bound serine protease (ClpP class)